MKDKTENKPPENKKDEVIDVVGIAFKNVIRNPINKIIHIFMSNGPILITAIMLTLLGTGLIIFIRRDVNGFLGLSYYSKVSDIPIANKLTLMFQFWQSVTIIFTVVIYFIQKRESNKADKFKNIKMEAEFTAQIDICPLNDNKFVEQMIKHRKFKHCVLREFEGIGLRTAFDLYPAKRKNGKYPLFRIVNCGKVRVEDFEFTVESEDVNVTEKFGYHFLQNETFVVTTGEEYKNIFCSNGNLKITLKYINKYTGQKIITEYEAAIKDESLYFPIDKNSADWSKIENRTLLLSDNNYEDLIKTWKHHYQDHRAGTYLDKYRYVEVDWNEVSKTDIEDILNIDLSDKYGTKNTLVMKRGLFIESIYLVKISEKDALLTGNI